MGPCQSASVTGVGEGPWIENSSKDACTKGHSPNWVDPEVRFLITIWKDRHPIRKRKNSAVWESIARELNSLLRLLCGIRAHINTVTKRRRTHLTISHHITQIALFVHLHSSNYKREKKPSSWKHPLFLRRLT